MSEEFKNSEILAKWVNGELSEEEITSLKATTDLTSLEKILKEVDTWSLPKLSEDSFAQLQTKVQKPKAAKVIPLYKRTAFKIAASIALVIGLFFAFNPFAAHTVTFTTASAETKEVSLPDGSIVRLNALSSISYDESDWPDERSVSIEGNAYFEVKKGSSFNVIFHSGEVKVLGTRFEVIADQRFFTVFCYEGKVLTKSKEDDLSIILTKGLGAIKQRGFPFESYEDTTNSTPTWLTQGKRVYKNAPLTVVMHDLKTQFAIEFESSINLNRKFTGTFVNTNLEAALKMVFTPLGINYKITGENTVELFE